MSGDQGRPPTAINIVSAEIFFLLDVNITVFLSTNSARSLYTTAPFFFKILE